jgi:hypothetical protein
VGNGGDLGWIAATFFSLNFRQNLCSTAVICQSSLPSLLLCDTWAWQISAPFFRKRKQKHKDAQPREDRGGDEACRRNLSARLKTRFEVSSDADQKE